MGGVCFLLDRRRNDQSDQFGRALASNVETTGGREHWWILTLKANLVIAIFPQEDGVLVADWRFNVEPVINQDWWSIVGYLTGESLWKAMESKYWTWGLNRLSGKCSVDVECLSIFAWMAAGLWVHFVACLTWMQYAGEQYCIYLQGWYGVAEATAWKVSDLLERTGCSGLVRGLSIVHNSGHSALGQTLVLPVWLYLGETAWLLDAQIGHVM